MKQSRSSAEESFFSRAPTHALREMHFTERRTRKDASANCKHESLYHDRCAATSGALLPLWRQAAGAGTPPGPALARSGAGCTRSTAQRNCGMRCKPLQGEGRSHRWLQPHPRLLPPIGLHLMLLPSQCHCRMVRALGKHPGELLAAPDTRAGGLRRHSAAASLLPPLAISHRPHYHWPRLGPPCSI